MARYSNFNGSILKHTKLIETDFLESSFSNIKLEHTEFLNCRLMKADFHHTSLNKMDFRTDEIEGMMVSLEDIKGLVITNKQVPVFFPMLGVTIKEEQNESD